MIKLIAPPTASGPYIEEAGPLITSTEFNPCKLVSISALWLKTPKGRNAKPSSKYKKYADVPKGWRIPIPCCSFR